MKCQVCNGEDTVIKTYEKEFIVKGKKINETVQSRFCKECGNFIYDETLDEESAKKVLCHYLKKYGIEPEKIRKLRKKYNVSQELFSKIIGCAKKTLISYENGTSIPNDTYMIVLKTLLENEDTIQPFIEANKERFTEKEYSKIQNDIYSHLKNNIRNLNNNFSTELSVYNGFSKFSFEKLKSIISFFSKNGVHKTKLLKELFYTDFKCYKEYGYSMIGLEYAKINYGPVPDGFEILLQVLIEQKIIELEITTHENYEEIIIEALKDPDFAILEESEISIIHEVKNYFKDFNVSKIVDFSHQEVAYQQTNNKELISYEYAADLQI